VVWVGLFAAGSRVCTRVGGKVAEAGAPHSNA
jgi:hypothetical protein